MEQLICVLTRDRLHFVEVVRSLASDAKHIDFCTMQNKHFKFVACKNSIEAKKWGFDNLIICSDMAGELSEIEKIRARLMYR